MKKILLLRNLGAIALSGIMPLTSCSSMDNSGTTSTTSNSGNDAVEKFYNPGRFEKAESVPLTDKEKEIYYPVLRGYKKIYKLEGIDKYYNGEKFYFIPHILQTNNNGDSFIREFIPIDGTDYDIYSCQLNGETFNFEQPNTYKGQFNGSESQLNDSISIIRINLKLKYYFREERRNENA